MRKTNKKALLLSFALCACAAIGVGTLGFDRAAAETTITVDETTKIASAGFTMETGASVRYKDNDGDKVNDEAGIRFTANVTSEFEAYLAEKYEGATITYRTLITAVNMLGEEQTIADVTVENSDALLCNDTKGTLSDGQYHGSVLYTPETGVDWSGLTDAQKLEIYKTELVARAYVKITKADGSVEVIYAQTEGASRSIRGVANAALIKGEDALLTGYVGEATRETELADYYDPDTKSGTISVGELANGTYEAYVGAALIGEVTAQDGEVTIENISGVEVGETTLNLFDENANVYSVPFAYPTKVIKTASDLNIFNLDNTNYAAIIAASADVDKTPTKAIEGYYVLGNDIDASSYAMPTHGYISETHNYQMKTHGFMGTFNGLGYTVNGITFGTEQQAILDDLNDSTVDYRSGWNGNTYGLFGIIGETATVKNFALTDVQFALKNGTATMYQAKCASLAMWVNAGATVENVYVGVKGITSWCDNSDSTTNMVKTYTSLSPIAYSIHSGATLNNVVSEYTYAGDDVLTVDKAGGLVYRLWANDTVSSTWTNTYVISEKPIAGSATASHALYAENDTTENVTKIEGTFKYNSVDAWVAAQEAEATKNNFSSFTAQFWNVKKGVPTWNRIVEKKEVSYTVNLDADKKTLSENDLNALFGSKEAALVSARSASADYTLSYENGALSVSATGGEIAWGGETFTAIFSDGNYQVTATVRLCTNVITTAAELGVFCLDNTDYTTMNLSTSTHVSRVPSKVVSGYYVLDNDIDASSYAMPTQGYIYTTHQYTMPNVGFQGTFDGCGYTISGITFGTDEGENAQYTSDNRTYWNQNTYSLFGIIGKNAVLKNVAITDVKFALKNTGLSLLMANCSALATWIESGATVENVYVSIKGIVSGGNATHTNVAALAYGIYSGAMLNNVVVDYTYSGDDVLAVTSSGALVTRKCANDTVSTTWQNVYVLSEKALAGSTTDSHVLYAENDTTADVTKIEGTFKYASLAAWKEAQESDTTKNDFTSFNGEACWDLTGGVPTWN